MERIPEELQDLFEEDEIRGVWWLAAMIAGVAVWSLIIGAIFIAFEVLK